MERAEQHDPPAVGGRDRAPFVSTREVLGLMSTPADHTDSRTVELLPHLHSGPSAS